MNDKDLLDLVESQIAHQGAACFQVKDGHVFILTKEMLERLVKIEETSGAGRVTVFIQHMVTQ